MQQYLIEHHVYLWGCLVLIIMAVLRFMFGNPFSSLQHTIYLSGTLGAGKTSYAALAVRHYRQRGYKVYSTFALEGAIPFDMSLDSWPKGNKIVVILDEMLRLKKQKFYDVGTLADGLTMARQWGQVVIVLSQSHLADLGDLEGTFQVFATTKKLIPLGPDSMFGNINIMRFSSNKFRRFSKLKADGMITKFVYISPRVWRDYDSKLIFGLTCNKDLSLIPESEIPERRIEREARWRLRKLRSEALAKQKMQEIIAAESAASGAVGPERSVSGSPAQPGAAAGRHVVPRPGGGQRGVYRPGGGRGG